MFRLSCVSTAMAFALLACPCGCRTDPLFEKRQKLDAPVTSLEHPEGVPLPDLEVSDAQEVDLVEVVLTHRANYYRSLKLLRDYYRRHGNIRKQGWAEFEIKDVERIRPFKYLLDSEVPSASLRPTKSIAEADALYNKGLELMKQGGHGVPVFYREDLMVEALKTFTELITNYPGSDKIDDAAFYCGEITKEYLKDQEEIALKWYERAWTWDPKTPHPARFQAAVVSDYRLHDRARALELYQQVLKHEPDNKSNATFAVARIRQLTEDLEAKGTRTTPAKEAPPPTPQSASKTG
ncbi:MAG: hypothetical protein V2A79_12885 [Planctomycetota bacterium]